jgi:hypothetical protein
MSKMKNKIIREYENKRWYRVFKSLYVFLFAATLILANVILFDEFDFWTFVITNAVIVFFFGATEGLFWYIARGKWGYPKEEESVVPENRA